jgi:hypothetical protein
MPPSAHTAAMKMTRLQSGALGVLSELTSFTHGSEGRHALVRKAALLGGLGCEGVKGGREIAAKCRDGEREIAAHDYRS